MKLPNEDDDCYTNNWMNVERLDKIRGLKIEEKSQKKRRSLRKPD